MNPQCARCGKVVYPTEKVNCLDKVLGRGRAGTAPPGRARPAPRGSGGAGRAGQGRAEPAGASGRDGRWQMQRFKGRRCARIRAVAAGGGRGRVTALARGERGPQRPGRPAVPPGNDGATRE